MMNVQSVGLWRRPRLGFQEVGKICLSLTTIIQDISLDDIDNYKSVLRDYYPGIDLLVNIYKQSIINIEDYYQTCTYIAAKTSNNQSEVNKMPFYVFNNHMIYLQKILEAENGDGKGGSEDSQQSAQKTMASSMSQAKSMMPKPGNFKMPSK